MKAYRQTKFIWFLIIIVYPISKLLFWFDVKGLENLPKSGGCIYASNHISFYDPIFWIIATKNRIRYMAKAELKKSKFLTWIFNKAGVFTVDRTNASVNTINTAIEIVNNGGILGIFPEGTRSKDGKPSRAKSGAAYIANATNVDVVPMAIVTKGKVRPFKKVKLIIGKPIKNNEIHFEGTDRKGLKSASERIMGDIKTLWEEGQNEL